MTVTTRTCSSIRAGSGFIDLDGVRLGLREEDVVNLAVTSPSGQFRRTQPTSLALARSDVGIRAYAHLAPVDRAVLTALERAVWFRLACLYRFRSTGRRIVPTLLGLAYSDGEYVVR